MTRKPLKHHNQNLFHSSDRFYAGAAVTSISSSWMVDEYLVEPRELEYLGYEEDVINRYNHLVDSQVINENVSMDYARSMGVENEWEIYNFFAQENVNAPTEVFEYIDDNGNVAYFTEEQQLQIQQWNPNEPYPVEGIEGHHMETIKENPDDRALAADSDNILFTTSDGHGNFLHGGNTKNATSEAYIGIDTTNEEKLEMTLSYNEEIITLNFWEAGALAVGGSAVVYVTASQVIMWAKLRKDPRPWAEKNKDLALNGIMVGIVGSGIASIGYAASSGINGLIGDFSVSGLEEFFGNMLAINGAFFAISIATASISYIMMRRKGHTHKQALRNFQSTILTATAELAAFSALGIGIEFGLDTLGELALDALIPDPTGLLIAARVSYKLIKMGKQFIDGKKEKQAHSECVHVRREYFYQQALIASNHI